MIEILLATYNGSDYLQVLLDSILANKREDFCILAHDDGSSDGTPSILEHYEKEYGIRVLKDGKISNNGAKDNFFFLMHHSKEEYVMFADQDDIWHENKIWRTMEQMRAVETKYGKSTPILVHSDLEVVGEELHQISPSLMKMQKLNPYYHTINRLLVQNNVTGCTMMANRALLNLLHENEEGIIMHDWWLALLAAQFGKIIYIDEALIQYRQHGDNSVGAKDVKSMGYFKSKVSNTGQIHQTILDTYRQAEVFFKQYGEKISDKQLFVDFMSLKKSNAVERLIKLSKHRLFKSGLYRKIGQIIYG